jgi:TM2 domain-containing membrane protein YozV
MEGLRRSIGLTIFFIWFLPVKTYPSATESYVSKNYYSALSLAEQTNDSVMVTNVHFKKPKSPWIALGIAFVPGVIVHGAGHFYAGRIKTGFLLLGTEVVGISLVGVGAIAGFAEAMGGEPTSDDAELWAFGGLILFVGSWVYDVVASPITVKKQNKELLQRRQGKLKFQIKEDTPRFVIIYNF